MESATDILIQPAQSHGALEAKAPHDLVKEESAAGSIFVQVDVGEPQSVQDIVQAAVKEFGRVDM